MVRDLPFELWERINVFAKEPGPCAVLITAAYKRVCFCSDCDVWHHYIWENRDMLNHVCSSCG